MKTIFWLTVALTVIALISVIVTVIKHNKMFKDNEDPVPLEDMPARYEDYEECFYNPQTE